MRRAAGVVTALALGCGAPPEAGERLDAAALWGPVAPPDQALTFARREAAGERALLLVRAIEGERNYVIYWLPEGAKQGGEIRRRAV